MPQLEAKIGRFWKWFAAGPARWKVPKDDFDEEQFLPLYDAIEAEFPELTPTTEWTPRGKFGLVFSVWRNRDEGDRRKAVPIIRGLVKSAPKLKQWRFVAFAPKVAWMDAFLPMLDLPDGSTLKVARMRFEVVARKPLHLRVYVPKLSKPKEPSFVIGVERVLEAGMGERWVLEDLARLEVADAKKAPKSARPIEELSRM